MSIFFFFSEQVLHRPCSEMTQRCINNLTTFTEFCIKSTPDDTILHMITEWTPREKRNQALHFNTIYLKNNTLYLHTVYCKQYAIQSTPKAFIVGFFFSFKELTSQ